MAGKIKTLFSDKEKTEPLFPRTKTSAVSADDGTGLDALLEHVGYYDDSDGTGASVPVDADSLGGLPAENYATQAFVTNKIAEAQVGGGDAGSVDLSGYVSKDDVIDIAHGGHSGTTAVEALANLGALNLDFITDDAYMIASGDDLNNYITPGAYRCASGAIATSLVNAPSTYNSGFRLIVSAQSATTGVVQFAVYNSKYTKICIRTLNGEGNWGEWQNLIFGDHNVKTYSDISQLGLSGGVTTDAVLAAMPTWSVVMFANSDKSGNYLTDAPTEYCNVVLFKSSANYGSGIATKVNSARQEHYMYGWYKGSSHNVWSAPGEANLLWTNASPTSTFASFTPISLDLTDYQYILVWYRLYGSDTMAPHISSLVPVGVGSGTDNDSVRNATTCFAAADDKWIRRYCFASKSAVTFGAGGYRTSVSGNYTVDSKYMIPERIYGIR